MNVVARWPGSAHDSTIFNNCEVRQQLERGEYGDYVIGYANTAYMCTPFRANIQLNAAQQLYQKYVFPILFYFKIFIKIVFELFCRSQIATRNVVERSYGVLKRRFPILHSGMQLHRLELIQNVICVCCVLHNICLDMGDTGSDFESIPNEPPDTVRIAPPQSSPKSRSGRATARNEVVALFAERLLQGRQ